MDVYFACFYALPISMFKVKLVSIPSCSYFEFFIPWVLVIFGEESVKYRLGIFFFFFFFMNGNTERAQCALSRVCIP